MVAPGIYGQEKIKLSKAKPKTKNDNFYSKTDFA